VSVLWGAARGERQGEGAGEGGGGALGNGSAWAGQLGGKAQRTALSGKQACAKRPSGQTSTHCKDTCEQGINAAHRGL
jgi:hypothetical protein